MSASIPLKCGVRKELSMFSEEKNVLLWDTWIVVVCLINFQSVKAKLICVSLIRIQHFVEGKSFWTC
jgi:hypothetical protein